MNARFLLASVALLVMASASGQRSGLQIPADQARDFIGHDATVCGKVESANFAVNAAGSPTFLHLGAAFPRQPFQIRINGAQRAAFDFAPEEALLDKVVCATGRIGQNARAAEILVRNPRELALAAD